MSLYPAFDFGLCGVAIKAPRQFPGSLVLLAAEG